MKFDKMGWMVAAALAAAMVGVGFQGSSPKFGNVDMAKVFNDCELTKSNNDKLKAYVQQHLAVLRFLNENKVMVPADAVRYAVIGIKENQTPAEKQEIERITGDATAASSRQRDLVQKQNATPDDLKQLQEFSARMQQNQEAQSKLEQQYDQDASQLQTKMRNDSLDKVRQAVSAIASKQGYTVIFSSESAPYASNDVTVEALNAVNKKG